MSRRELFRKQLLHEAHMENGLALNKGLNRLLA